MEREALDPGHKSRTPFLLFFFLFFLWGGWVILVRRFLFLVLFFSKKLRNHIFMPKLKNMLPFEKKI